IAVFYDGFNELLNTYIELDPAHPDLPLHADRERMAELLENPNDPVATYARYSAWHMLRFALGGGDFRPPPPRDVALIARTMVGSYNASVDVIRRLGHSYGIRTAFFWQPTIFTKKPNPAEAELQGSSNPRK